jgi:hypothetical protein
MPVEVRNELHWGEPDLTQLESIFLHNQPGCVVAIDRAGIRYFSYGFGELQKLRDVALGKDTKNWKRKDYGHSAAPGTHLSHGPQSDAFQKRVDAQFNRMYRRVAQETETLCTANHLSWILLVGPARMLTPLKRAFGNRRDVRIAEADIARMPYGTLKARIAEYASAR